MEKIVYQTADGMRTVTLEAQGGKFVVWTDDDFVKYAYMTSDKWLRDDDVELFGRPGHILMYGNKPEVFLDGKSLRDGTEYSSRMQEMNKQIRCRSKIMLGAGAVFLAAFILVLLFVSRPGTYCFALFLGIALICFGLTSRSKAKNFSADFVRSLVCFCSVYEITHKRSERLLLFGSFLFPAGPVCVLFPAALPCCSICAVYALSVPSTILILTVQPSHKPPTSRQSFS